MPTTSNVAILAYNHVDNATAFSEGPFFDLWADFSESVYASSGGTNTMPVSNLKDPDLDVPWRSLDINKDWTWFTIDLGSSKTFDGIVLVDTNFTTSAKWRVITSDYSDFSVVSYDSGLVSARPPTVSFGSLPWGSFPWGGQVVVGDDNNPYNIDCWMRITPGQVKRYVRVYIEDENNLDGYVQVGRAIVSPIYQPTNNMALGTFDIKWVDPSVVSRPYGGGSYADERVRYRMMHFVIEYIKEAEIYANVFDVMDRQLGSVKPFYVIPQPDKPEVFVYEAMYCRQSDMTPINNPIFDGRTKEFTFEEVK